MEAQKALDRAKLPRISQRLSVKFAQGSIFLGDEWKNTQLRKEQNARKKKHDPFPRNQNVQKHDPFPWPQPIVQNAAPVAGGAAVHHMAHHNIQGTMAPMGRAGARPMGNKNMGNHSPQHVIGRSPSDPFVSTEPTVLPSPDDPNSWLRPLPPIKRTGPAQSTTMPPPGQRATMPPPAPLPLGSTMGQQAFGPQHLGSTMGHQAYAPPYMIPFAPSGSAFYPQPHGFVVPGQFPTMHNQNPGQYPGQHPGWFFFPPAPVPAMTQATHAPFPAAPFPAAPIAPFPDAPVAVAPPAPAAPTTKIPSSPVAIFQDSIPDDAIVEEVVLESGHRYLFCEGRLISKESPSPSFIPSKPTQDSPTPVREPRRPLVVNGSYGGIHHQLAMATSGRMPVTAYRSVTELVPEGTVPKAVIVQGKKRAASAEMIPEGSVPRSVIAQGKKKMVSPPIASSLSSLSPVPASIATSDASLPAFIQPPPSLASVCATEDSPPVATRFPSPPWAFETDYSPPSPPPPGDVSSSSTGTIIDYFGETVVRHPSRAQFTRLPSEWTSAPSSDMPDPDASIAPGSTSLSPLPNGQIYAPGPGAIHNWHLHANAGPGGPGVSPIGPPPDASSVEVHHGFYGEIEPFPLAPSSNAGSSAVLRKDKKKKKTKKATIPNRPPPAASSIEIHQGLYEFPPLSSGLSTGPPSEAGVSSAPAHKGKAKGKKGPKNPDKSALGPASAQTKVHPAGRKANNKKKERSKRLSTSPDVGAAAAAAAADVRAMVDGLRPIRQRVVRAGGAGGAQALRDLFVAPPAGGEGEASASFFDDDAGAVRGGGGGQRGLADAESRIHGCFTGLPPSFDPWPRVGSEGGRGQ